MKHIKLFESSEFYKGSGLGEIEIEEGLAIVFYKGSDMEFMKSEYEALQPEDKTFEEFVKEMTTPGIYGEDEYGGPWEIIHIKSSVLDDFLEDKIFGMIYRF